MTATKTALCPTTKKHSYPDQLEAERMLAHLILHRTNQRACRAYQCGFCSNWHLTSQPRREPSGRKVTA